MKQDEMAGLIANAMGGEVNGSGEIEAKNFEVVNALADTPTRDAFNNEGAAPPPNNTPADNKNQTPPADSSLNIDFDKILAEKTAGKYKSLEDLNKVEDVKFSNELVAKINDFSKKFNDPQAALELFLKTQTTDYSKMSYEDAIRTKIKMENPELTDKEIEYDLRTKYKQDADLYSEEEMEIGKTKMEREGKKAVEDLIKTQQELALKGDYNAEAEAQQAEEFKKLKQAWDTETEQALSAVDKMEMEIKISDEEKQNFEWKFTDDDKKEASEMVKSMGEDSGKFFELFKNDQGGYDKAKLATAYLKLKKFDAIIGAAVDQAVNAGKQNEIKKLKNTDFEPAKNPSGSQPMTMEEQVAQQFSKYI